MSTAREELARVLDDAFRKRQRSVLHDDTKSTWEVLAEAILAAGWQSPAHVEAALAEQAQEIDDSISMLIDRLPAFAGGGYGEGKYDGLVAGMMLARTYTQEASE